MKAAAAAFFDHMHQATESQVPTIRQAILGLGGDWGDVDDGHIHAEAFPAVLAMGLQPVRNFWDDETFDRAREELARVAEELDKPARDFLNRRLDEHLRAWRCADPTKGGNLPWDEVAAGVIAHLGIGSRVMLGDKALMHPGEIMALGAILSHIAGTFWIEIKEYKLT